MKNLGFAVLALATALATAPAAMAGPSTVPIYVDIWGTSTSDPLATSGVGQIALGSGTLMGISEGGGLYDITGGSITINGQTGTVVANGSFPTVVDSDGFAYDDAFNLSTAPNYVDKTGGLLLMLPGGMEAAIYLDSNGAINYNDVIEFFQDPSGPYTPSNDGYDVGLSASLTPEPSSWLLMGTGLLFLVGFLYRKAKPGLNRAA